MENYWKECVEVALEEAGVKATEQQIADVAESVEGGFENYGMHMGYECIPNPLETEVQKLKTQVSEEQESAQKEIADRDREHELEIDRLRNIINDLRQELGGSF